MDNEILSGYIINIHQLCQELIKLNMFSESSSSDLSERDWQKFLRISLELENYEQSIVEYNHDIEGEIIDLKTQISAYIEQYNLFNKI
jgi:hypothetical protein